MKDPKDIERLFDRADEKLTERPSPSAWQRLSEKLDHHDQHSGGSAAPKVVPIRRRFPAWQVAASLLLLVGLFTFAINQIPNEKKHMVMADAKVQLEDVPLEEPNSGFYALAVKCRQFYNTSPSQAIAESKVPSRLRLAKRQNRHADAPSQRTAMAERSESNTSVSNSTTPVSNEQTTSASEIFASTSDYVEADDYADSITVLADAAAASSTPSQTREDVEDRFMRGESVPYTEPSSATTINEMEPPVVASADIEAEQQQYGSSRSSKKTRKDKASTKEEAAAAVDEMAINATSNVMDYDANNAEGIAADELAAFKWLIGSWSAVSQQQEVKQDWQLKDQFTLVGQATFTINGQAIQVQSMEIKKQADGIYLLLANKADNTTQQYRLKSMEAYKATFAERGEEFIIEQVGNNQFMNFSNQPVYQSSMSNGAFQFNGLNFNRVEEE